MKLEIGKYYRTRDGRRVGRLAGGTERGALRDEFAIAALISMGTWVPNRPDGTYPNDGDEVLRLKAEWAYALSDAMMKARETTNDN